MHALPKKILQPVLMLVAASATVCLVASGQHSVAADAGVGSEVMPATDRPVAAVPPVMDAPPLGVALSPLSAEERAQVAHLRSWDGPLRLGFGRSLGASVQPLWHATPRGGHAFAWKISSPGAVGLRLAVLARQLPDEATLWVSAPDTADRPQTVSGAEVNASIRRNLDAGNADDAARLFWLPLVVGDVLVLQVELPASVGPLHGVLDLVRVSHAFSLPFLESRSAPAEAPDQATDPACTEGWDVPSRATTLLLYTDPDGGTGACTATLLNDADPETLTPYLASAHHCFHDQVRASSIESLWFLRAAACGGPLDVYETVSGGADVLYVAKSTDTSLLRLRRPPPTGAVFIGRRATLPPKGTEVVTIHHPRAGLQQRSVAVVSGYKNCAETDYCGDDADSNAVHFLRVDRRVGSTSPGSSGAGLFNQSQQLIGTLLGGTEEGEHGGFDYYGRLDVPYFNALHRWLGWRAGDWSGAGGAMRKMTLGVPRTPSARRVESSYIHPPTKKLRNPQNGSYPRATTGLRSAGSRVGEIE